MGNGHTRARIRPTATAESMSPSAPGTLWLYEAVRCRRWPRARRGGRAAGARGWRVRNGRSHLAAGRAGPGRARRRLRAAARGGVGGCPNSRPRPSAARRARLPRAGCGVSLLGAYGERWLGVAGAAEPVPVSLSLHTPNAHTGAGVFIRAENVRYCPAKCESTQVTEV